jgi:glutamine synthetase adenylyltransferase
MSLEDAIDISPMEREELPKKEEKESTDGDVPAEAQDKEEDTPRELTEEEIKKQELGEKMTKLQNEILELKLKLQEKEKELAEVKEQLGITAYTEFKDSLSHGWKVLGDKWGEVKESERYKKADSTVTGWKQKIEGSEKYQKTKDTLSDWGGKASDAVKKTGTAIKENETVQSIGQRMRTATIKLKDTWNRTMSTDEDAETVEGREEGKNGVFEEPQETKPQEEPKEPAEKDQ